MWQIEYEKQAKKFLSKAEKNTKIQILKYLEKISQKPRSFGKPLMGKLRGLWRYRVGDYRIICNIEDKKITILVLDIGHRSTIYKET